MPELLLLPLLLLLLLLQAMPAHALGCRAARSQPCAAVHAPTHILDGGGRGLCLPHNQTNPSVMGCINGPFQTATASREETVHAIPRTHDLAAIPASARDHVPMSISLSCSKNL